VQVAKLFDSMKDAQAAAHLAGARLN